MDNQHQYIEDILNRTVGEDQTKMVMKEVTGLEEALNRCQLKGRGGVLDQYAATSSTITESIQKAAKDGKGWDPDYPKVWHYIDNMVADRLKEKCSCRIT